MDESSNRLRAAEDRQQFETFARTLVPFVPMTATVPTSPVETNVLHRRLSFPFAVEHGAYTIKEIEIVLTLIEFADESAVQLMGSVVDLHEVPLDLPQRVEWRYLEMFGAPMVLSLFEDEPTGRFGARVQGYIDESTMADFVIHTRSRVKRELLIDGVSRATVLT